MFEDAIMLKNHRRNFNKHFHYHNNYIMINNTIIIIKTLIIKIIIAVNLTIFVFRQIINETIKINNMIKINKKVTITIFNLVINKIFFLQSINNNVLLKHFRNKQHDKNLHEMYLFHFRRQFIITSSKKNILKKKSS